MKIVIFDGTEQPKEIDLVIFEQQPAITFGRDKTNSLVLTSPLVSRHHGRIRIQEGQLLFEDIGSKNGLIHNGFSTRECFLREGDMLRIDDGIQTIREGVLILLETDAYHGNWIKHDIRNLHTITIGRAKDSTICLDHVTVSSKHAMLERVNQHCYIQDCNSTNGVFVNGFKINGKTQLQEKDIITITNTKLIYTSDQIFYCCYRSGIRIEGVHLVETVKAQGKSFNICNDVSLSIHPGELIAIVGGSGAGKTTLMNMISGYKKPTSGQVYMNGEELYASYDSLKHMIGYVPQQDIVYDNLTLFHMLDYAAKLRLPDDTKVSERKQRVQCVIDMMELQGKETTMIRRLSGGQKKRASIAVELLSDPNLFFLDEPASGLDPGTECNLMKTLKDMTRTGKTVILVTHSTLNLRECDRIIFMGKGGNLCYFGNARDAETFFQVDNLVDVYNLLTNEADWWRELYDASAIPLNQHNDIGKKSLPSKSSNTNRHSRLRQVGILGGRYARLLINDRQRLFMLLLQAPLLAFLISFVKDGNQFEQHSITKSLLFALSCSGFWIGTLNAIQEVCKERNILKREYMTGLHLVSYMASKFMVLGLLCFVQSALLTTVFSLMVGTPEEGVMGVAFVELFITTFLTAFSAAAMGIFASSFFKNADRAMTAAPILLMPQILFSGLLFKLKGVTKTISWFVICRWSMEGYGTSADLNGLQYMVEIDGKMTEIQRKAESFFEYTKLHLLQSWVIMIAFVLAFAVLSGVVLRNIKKNK